MPQILINLVGQLADKQGLSYSIVTDVSRNPEHHSAELLTSWSIRIADTSAILTTEILSKYENEYIDLKNALKQYLNDHFSYFK